MVSGGAEQNHVDLGASIGAHSKHQTPAAMANDALNERDEIDLECERLKESYTQHRLSRKKSQERSKSGMRNQSRSIGRGRLVDSTLEHTLLGNKENSENDMRDSTSNFQNRYKRSGRKDDSI